jgi:hypothetical protein
MPAADAAPTEAAVVALVSKQIGRDLDALVAVPTIADGIRFTVDRNAKFMFAFEVPDPNLIYLPCTVRERQKKTESLKDVSSVFLVGLPQAATTEMIADAVERKLETIWTIDPDEPPVHHDIQHALDLSQLMKEIKFAVGQRLAVWVGRYAIYTPLKRQDPLKVFSSARRHFVNFLSVFLNPAIPVSLVKLTRNLPWFMRSSLSQTFSDEVTLRDCFVFLAQPEVLDEKNKWECPRCGQSVCATKKVDVWKVPDVLIIQLKRFVRSGHVAKKLERTVEFPERMNFREFIVGPQSGQDQWYRLYAVSNHTGTLNGGHYTANAIVQSPFDEPSDTPHWCLFNDSAATDGEPGLSSSSAYLLFYEKIPAARDTE